MVAATVSVIFVAVIAVGSATHCGHKPAERETLLTEGIHSMLIGIQSHADDHDKADTRGLAVPVRR